MRFYMARRPVMALLASLTSYAIFLAEFGEDLARRVGPALCDVLQTLAQPFFGVGVRSEIQQALIGGERFERGAGGVLAGGGELRG